MSRVEPEITAPVCPYCDQTAELVAGDVIYPHRPDLSSRCFWRCEPCGAWVGTHKDSKRHAPLGRLANVELRKAKQQAHAVFDPLWKGKMRRDKCSKTEARQAGYRWLADQLEIEGSACHIGMFDVETCRRVVAICWKVRQPDK